MPKRSGILIVIMGAVLMLSALLLLCYKDRTQFYAGQQSEQLLQAVQEAVQTQAAVPTQTPSAQETEADLSHKEMPTVQIDGFDYIGSVAIDDLQLELPVMAQWDYDRLRIAPCRHFGTTYGDDLVIAAHNYESHFGGLSSLQEGAAVRFTDAEGVEITYQLVRLTSIAADDVSAVLYSGHDLVLYTCTPGGKMRVAAFCDRTEPAA